MTHSKIEMAMAVEVLDRLDHNGDCQEHGWHTGPCGNAQMAELFTDVGALGVNRG